VDAKALWLSWVFQDPDSAQAGRHAGLLDSDNIVNFSTDGRRACSTSALFLYTASTFSTAMYSPAGRNAEMNR